MLVVDLQHRAEVVVDNAGNFFSTFLAQHGELLGHGGKAGYIRKQDCTVMEVSIDITGLGMLLD